MTASPVGRSALWSRVFRGSYRVMRAIDPLMQSMIALGVPGTGAAVQLRMPGRVSGEVRHVTVTLLRVDGHWYVGHPNGECVWIRNAKAAGWVDVDPAGAEGARRRFVEVPPGPERDAVIRATWSQQPFPANLLYRAAKRHVAAVGSYHRLEAVTGAPTPPADAPSADPVASTTTDGAP